MDVLREKLDELEFKTKTKIYIHGHAHAGKPALNYIVIVCHSAEHLDLNITERGV